MGQPPISDDPDDGSLPDIEHRAAPRFRADELKPMLSVPGGSTAAIKLHDLSAIGFRTEWFAKLNVGQRVRLKIAGLDGLAATVAWEKNFTIGCKFDAPLHPTALERFVETK